MTIIPQVFAADPTPAADTSVNISGLYNPAPKIPLTSKVTDIFTKGGFDLINFVFIIIGLIFFANLVMAGWDYMMSSGDPKKVAAATTRLINGFVGLIMAVAAFVVVRLITNVLGLGNLI
jgi:hypothetical protein